MPDTPDAVMLFAAGFGTRMGALTAQRPKPLIPVADRPLIDHALDQIAAAGIPRVVANIHHHSDLVRAHLAPRGVAISHETQRILETGGGLRHALPLLPPGPVYTMNSDAIWTGANPLRQLAAGWDPARMDALLLVVRPGDAHGHTGAGDFTLRPDHRLERGPDLIYSGVQIIRTDLLADIPDEAFSLNILWDMMARRARLFGVTHRGKWCDVGHPGGISIAEDLLKATDV